MDIAVTGAAGRVGREAIDALSGHDVTAITHREHDDIESVVADLSDRETLAATFRGTDVVVHLAADSNSSATWESVLGTNIDGTRTVYEAALEADVRRVVFASSNHTTGMYNIADPTERGTMTKGDVAVVDPTDPPRPDGFYGVSKVAGEALGSFYADRHGVEVVNLRIGWYLTREELRETLSGDPERGRFARALWLSPEDCRQVVRQCVCSDIPENPLTIHAISANDDRYVTLTPTIQAIDYRPEANSAAVDP